MKARRGNKNLRDFIDGYVRAAMWISTDDSEENLDDNHEVADIAGSSMRSIMRDCAKFVKANKSDLEKFVEAAPHSDSGPWSLAGYCFWMNRNSHGVGFWDRDVGAVGDRLSEASHKAGFSDMYVGDDGQIYVSPER